MCGILRALEGNVGESVCLFFLTGEFLQIFFYFGWEGRAFSLCTVILPLSLNYSFYFWVASRYFMEKKKKRLLAFIFIFFLFLPSFLFSLSLHFTPYPRFCFFFLLFSTLTFHCFSLNFCSLFASASLSHRLSKFQCSLHLAHKDFICVSPSFFFFFISVFLYF